MTTPANADDPIIAIEDLTRSFRGRVALDRVNLRVARGTVLGLVGVNGAGKTTLLRHILGQLAAQSGRVRVFGLDPVADPVGVLSRVGHLADAHDLPGWMRVGELLSYTGGVLPRLGRGAGGPAVRAVRPRPAQRIDTLSWGLRVRAGLAAALGHRPDLLVLDEPSAGLDPLARRYILQAVIRTAAEAGTTVLFSSHLLDEVERIADQVALLDAGRLVFCGDLDTIRGRHRRLTLRFAEPRRRRPALAGVLRWEGEGREWTAVCWGDLDELERAAAGSGGEIVEQSTPMLAELMEAHRIVRAPRGGAAMMPAVRALAWEILARYRWSVGGSAAWLLVACLIAALLPESARNPNIVAVLLAPVARRRDPVPHGGHARRGDAPRHAGRASSRAACCCCPSRRAPSPGCRWRWPSASPRSSGSSRRSACCGRAGPPSRSSGRACISASCWRGCSR